MRRLALKHSLRQCEPKATALAQFAVDADLSAHRFDERLRNRQAQTAAARVPGA